jgi:hypothetical protein
MPTHLVNLDALIPREDFEVAGGEVSAAPSTLVNTLNVTELVRDGLTYNVLRKPDFQRETADWGPEKVAQLVQSFLEGDLIPSVILWRSPKSGNIFVIDGAHRLSAFIAWVNDDYGDGDLSISFFSDIIPSEQKRAADRTRQLINGTVGSYQNLRTALQYQETAAKDRLRLARNLSTFGINLQWVPGDAEKAESSFFRINQQAAPIESTELEMIKARRKPNAVATRALIRAGTGHKYWSRFSREVQSEVEQLAGEVYDLLFRPTLDTPIKTTDVPVAGRGYSADSVKMVFELVNYVNNLDPEMWQEPRRKRDLDSQDGNYLPDDNDGSVTLRYMKSVRRVASQIAGNDSSSLGLHPLVYFYGATGRFQPTSFLAAVALVRELEGKRRLAQFTAVRYKFEEFLVQYKHFSNQVAQNYGSVQRGLEPLLIMYREIIAAVRTNSTDAEIIEHLKSQPRLRFLREITDEDRKYGRNFSRETKSAVYLREAMEKALRCSICGARLHSKSISYDHKIRRQDGGLGSPDNAQLTHPYCNSGYKESLHSRSVEEPT